MKHRLKTERNKIVGYRIECANSLKGNTGFNK